MTAAAPDRAAPPRASKIAWARLPDMVLGAMLCAVMAASGGLFVLLSF